MPEEKDLEQGEALEENQEPSTEGSGSSKFGFRKLDIASKVSTKTKELIEIAIAIAFLVFVFKLKADGMLDNPIGILGDAFGF